MTILPKHITRTERYDIVAYAFIGAGFVLALPQLYDIYTTHDVSGISIITWSGWIVLSLFWIIYGIERKNPMITISSFVKLMTNAFIVYGILLYG